MVQNDIHRSHVLASRRSGKMKDSKSSCMRQPVLVLVQGCGRKDFACSGNGNGTSWNNRGSNGNYWSSSLNSATNGRNLNFNSGGVNPQNYSSRFLGFAVRAVQHTILTILFILFVMYGTDTSAATTRFVSGLLRCEEAQVASFLCEEMGSQPEAEHGRAMRRFVLQTLQAPAIEVLHCGLPEEEGDIRCNVQGQNRASSVLQLHARPVREDVHSGQLFLHQETWYSLWHRTYHRLLSQGKPELADEMLRDAPRHQRVLHAYCQEEVAGDRLGDSQEDGYASDRQGLYKDVERCPGYGLAAVAVGNHHHARPEGELHNSGRPEVVGGSRPSEVHASPAGRSRSAYRESHKSVVLECLSQRVRPVHEEGTEMPLLRKVCGRCSGGVLGQGMAAVARTENQGVPASGTWLGPAYGQAGSLGGTSRSGVLRSVHQALEDVHIQPCPGAYDKEDRGVRLLEAMEGVEKREQLSRNIPACGIVQASSEDIHAKGVATHRHIQSGNDQVYRQAFILSIFKN